MNIAYTTDGYKSSLHGKLLIGSSRREGWSWSEQKSACKSSRARKVLLLNEVRVYRRQTERKLPRNVPNNPCREIIRPAGNGFFSVPLFLDPKSGWNFNKLRRRTRGCLSTRGRRTKTYESHELSSYLCPRISSSLSKRLCRSSRRSFDLIQVS